MVNGRGEVDLSWGRWDFHVKALLSYCGEMGYCCAEMYLLPSPANVQSRHFFQSFPPIASARLSLQLWMCDQVSAGAAQRARIIIIVMPKTKI